MDPVIKTFSLSGDAVEMFEALCAQAYPFFLDSSLRHAPRGRYSVMGCDPFDVVRGGRDDLLDVLERKFRNFSDGSSPGTGLPFEGGVAGALSYDYGLRLQKMGSRHSREDQQDGVFGFYDTAVVIDHERAEWHVVSTGRPETNPSLRRTRAKQRARWMEGLIQKRFAAKGRVELRGRVTDPYDGGALGAPVFNSNMTREQYVAMIRKAQELIAAGEIYQVNLSQKFTCPWPAGRESRLDLYRCLRLVSPSSFSAYYDAGDFALISSSPERFLHSDGFRVQTIPMKGTRRRGINADDDQRQKRDLWSSPKDQAELLMITDLMRSDLGRVCGYGSVRVEAPRQMEEYATVYQTTSTVEGVLRPDVSPFDILRATFPGGSITGCPKIRSMQVIDELEPEPRGFFTGALGYMGFNGRMDFSVLIRTMIVDQRQCAFSAGGGIVADSDPEKEYEETLIKIAGMRRAVGRMREAYARKS